MGAASPNILSRKSDESAPAGGATRCNERLGTVRFGSCACCVVHVRVQLALPRFTGGLTSPFHVYAVEESSAKPWLVLYTKQGTTATRICVSVPAAYQGSGGPRYMARVDTTKYGTSELFERTRTRVAYSSAPTHVVGAQLSCNGAILVIATIVRVVGARDKAWGTYFRFQAVSCSDWSIRLPVIDVLDSSEGGVAAPIFSIRCLLVNSTSTFRNTHLCRASNNLPHVQAACHVAWIRVPVCSVGTRCYRHL